MSLSNFGGFKPPLPNPSTIIDEKIETLRNEV
jgi:hypothetical protein